MNHCPRILASLVFAASLVACAGEDGEPGPTGSAGAQGEQGLTGVAGADGVNGTPGATGAAGASGVVKVLSIDASFGPIALPGNNGSTIITPVGCRTPAYVAGQGETAIITLSATLSPSGPVNDVLYLDPTVSTDGGAFTSVLAGYAAESLSNGTAHVSLSLASALEPGKSYAFGAGVSTKTAVNGNAAYCQGTIMIVKTSS